jgi:hypothetical protein
MDFPYVHNKTVKLQLLFYIHSLFANLRRVTATDGKHFEHEKAPRSKI